MSMQRCGFCTFLSSMFRKAMCIRSRRGSTESYYRELDDQDTLKIDDKSSDESDDLIQEVEGVTQAVTEGGMARPHLCPGRFLTMRKRRKRQRKPKTRREEEALLDDMQVGQVQCMLHQSVTWKFNAFNLETVSGGRCLMVLCVHLFHEYGLITHFDLDVIKLWKLFSLIEDGYRNTNPYHNSVHAADVTQAMHCFLQQKEILEYLTPVEIMSSLLAAMAHDMDHPGVNQPFLIATSNHLAALYENTSVLENHHWRTAISCLLQSRLLEGSDICEEVERQISSLIMATDITRQQEYLHRFKTLMDTNTLDMTNSDHRHLVLQIALKCADISNPCRPWEISMKWSLKVCEEFFRQGDYERKLNLPITALCDRYTTSIPKIQTGFFKYVVMPLFTQWHRFLHSDLSTEMLENLLYNQDKWDALEAEEIAREKKKKATEELKNSLLTNITDISELLLPLRRGSLNPARPINFKEQLRRFSVPLNVFQDTKSKYKEKDRGSLSAELRIKGFASFIGSEHSLHTQLRDQREPNDDAEKVLSTENLLPDASKVSITKPVVATRQNTIIKGGGTWKLIRQQTFPPWASIAHTHAQLSRSTSDEDTVHGQADLAKLKKDAKVRREAAIVGSRLRDNLFAMQNKSADEFLSRTKSMPVNPTYIENERKMRELKLVMPEMLRCALTGKDFWPRRRRSAPAPVASSDQNSLRNLASPGALRHSINGAGRRPSHILTCQQWIAKQYAAREIPRQLPRRSSLPVEVYRLTKDMDYASDEN